MYSFLYFTYCKQTTFLLFFLWIYVNICILYTNLTPKDKALFEKCHSYHNELFNNVSEILTEMLGPIYGFPLLRMITILKLSIHELKMVKANLQPVGLHLNIDFKSYLGLIDHKLFFPALSFTNKSKYTNSFLT